MFDRSIGVARVTARSYRGRVGRTALAALGAAALMLGGALPATADPGTGPGTASDANATAGEVLDAIGVAAPLVSLAEVDMTVTGWPEATEAGAVLEVGFDVQNALLGAAAPTGEVSVVAFVGGAVGFEVLDTQPLVAGEATTVLRPMGLGTQQVVAVYTGDGTHMPLVQFLDPLVVHPVSTVVNVEIDSNSPAYGGGTLGVWVTVLSACENGETDPDVRAMCQSTHGDPDGEVTLLMDGEAVGTEPIEGSNQLGAPAWLDLGVDLSNPDAKGVKYFEIDVPDRVLGTPEHYTFTAEFTASNWFVDAASGAVAVETQPGETGTQVMLGDLETQIRTVQVGELVDVTAFAWAEPSWSGPLDGVVNLWVNDELAAEGLSFGGEFPSATANISLDEAGEYALVAEFVPLSLNHTGSKSAAYTFTVENVAPNPDPAPTPDPAPNPSPEPTPTPTPSDGGANKPQKPAAQTGQLAHTGSDGVSAVVGAGMLALAGAGLALILARRRRADNTQT